MPCMCSPGRHSVLTSTAECHLKTSFPGCLAVVNQMVGEVIPTRVQLTFSQCQNFIADISLERNYTYFFWGHSDVALLASTPEKGFAEEVNEADTNH